MDAQHYKHDFEHCEVIGRRVGVLLARGEYQGAFRSLRMGVELELIRMPTPAVEMPIVDLDLGARITNALEERIGAIYVRDLAGVTAEDLQFAGSHPLSGSAAEMIEDAFRKVGLPFPLPHDYEAPERLDFNTSHSTPRQEQPMALREYESTNIIDIICNSGPEQINQIDREIEELKDRITKLQKARKLLGGVAKGKSSKPKGTPSGQAIIEYLRALSPSGAEHKDDLVEQLGLTPRQVTMAAHHSKQLAIDEHGNVTLLEGSGT